MPDTLTSDYASAQTNWQKNHSQWVEDFTSHRLSFISGLLPEWAVSIPNHQLLPILEKRLGKATLEACLQPEETWPAVAAGQPSANWLKRTNMAGINVRTIQNFWNVVKYTLTLPASQSAIHLLPIWEPGVVSSLYGIASWNINPEFFSRELY